MDMRQLCAQYQHAVSKKDLAAVEALFLQDAVVSTPIRGVVGVTDFHDFLFRHAKQGVARFPNVFVEKVNPSRISLQFSYTFLSQSAILGGVDGVVVFEYDDSLERFRSLRIEYDAAVIRRFLELENIVLPGHASDGLAR